MKTKIIALMAGVAIVCFLVGCASQPVVMPTVGPEPSHAFNSSQAHGYLRVYSDTETHQIGQNTYYYPHTPYNIYDESGLRVKWVPNHIGDMDETPTVVKLPVGRYFVLAESSSYGRVTVPIVIKEARWTILHLNRDWRPSPNISSNSVVRLPDGEAVGWSVAMTR